MRPVAIQWLRARAGFGVAVAAALVALLMLGSAAQAGAPLATALLGLVLALCCWLIWDTWLRLRLGVGEAPGVVEIREGRIGYFGPQSGGIIDLDVLESIAVEPASKGAVWVLRAADGEAVRIPMAAQGADKLLDAFAALPGFVAARVARVAAGRQPLPIWHRLPNGNDDARRSALASHGTGS